MERQKKQTLNFSVWLFLLLIVTAFKASPVKKIKYKILLRSRRKITAFAVFIHDIFYFLFASTTTVICCGIWNKNIQHVGVNLFLTAAFHVLWTNPEYSLKDELHSPHLLLYFCFLHGELIMWFIVLPFSSLVFNGRDTKLQINASIFRIKCWLRNFSGKGPLERPCARCCCARIERHQDRGTRPGQREHTPVQAAHKISDTNAWTLRDWRANKSLQTLQRPRQIQSF